MSFSAKILNGKKVAEGLLASLKEKTASLKNPPRLDVILAGDNDASLSYIRQKTKSAESCGIIARVHKFSADVEEKTVVARIKQLNHTTGVDGIIVQLPLPAGFDEQELLGAVAVSKDVDGLHPRNFGRLLAGVKPLYYPPTPSGIIRLLNHYELEISGKCVALVGMGRLVGRPLSQILLNQNATVLCLHELTADICSYTGCADIVVAGAGVPELVDSDYIKKDAVVIDAGIHKINGKLVGDVNFADVAEKASWITPVPGGVGPLTVAELLNNTVISAQHHASGEF
ncbi:MAG: bifunctional 5,10-methylenetetrahydrofolate dehydrogenase/5,10-methenyltetrahydrofolate cyclohydrolase [bacterium]